MTKTPSVVADSCLDDLLDQATEVLQLATDHDISLVTAESCTGGLVASLLTDIEGMSSAFERGFAVYSNAAKAQMLGIDRAMIEDRGAVSEAIAAAMAAGALDNSEGDVAVAITGFAGPAGDRDEEGLVFLAARSRQGHAIARECHFGPCGRDRVRELAARAALEMLSEVLDQWDDAISPAEAAEEAAEAAAARIDLDPQALAAERLESAEDDDGWR